MSDPRHMHECDPRRKDGACKVYVGGSICGLPENALVHQRFIEKQRELKEEGASGHQRLFTEGAEIAAFPEWTYVACSCGLVSLWQELSNWKCPNAG